jgi:hypothetical protein
MQFTRGREGPRRLNLPSAAENYTQGRHVHCLTTPGAAANPVICVFRDRTKVRNTSSRHPRLMLYGALALFSSQAFSIVLQRCTQCLDSLRAFG